MSRDDFLEKAQDFLEKAQDFLERMPDFHEQFLKKYDMPRDEVFEKTHGLREMILFF